MGYKIGIDVGGTFTDFLLSDEGGQTEVYKVPTTPNDPSIAVLRGLAEMAQKREAPLEEFIKGVEVIVHGTTVTTNAVLTGSGARTGLLTTKGFRDALQMRRGLREEMYDNKYIGPAPLVPRYLRLPVEERVSHSGEVVTPLRSQDVWEALEKFTAEGVEAVAICFLHSYANSVHEKQVEGLVREGLPGTYITLSSELLPQIRFYERVSTTVLNSYVGPIITKYLSSLTERLTHIGFEGVLLVMQSNGGVMSPAVARERAASTLLSGPAAGPVAGMAYASVQGYGDCITVDMGGTSFDAAMVKDGLPLAATEGRLNRHALALPMLDINTIGAGGGSIGWIDDGGLLRMGPHSAGAVPGPACYGLGGRGPTCTDADLLLGYLNKDYFLGGRISLDYGAAEKAIHEHIAVPLALSVAEAAAGMFEVINVNMASGIREISVQRGYDPRDFPLVVAGGAGGVHAGMIAQELDIPVILVPRDSSTFCAVGMLLSDLRHDFVRTYHVPFASVSRDRFRSLFQEMEAEAQRVLRMENVAAAGIGYLHSVEMRYAGQYHEVDVVCSPHSIHEVDLPSVASSFHKAHDRLYGYSLEEEGSPLEIVNLRLRAIGRTEKPSFRTLRRVDEDMARAKKGKRAAYLPKQRTFAPVDVFDGMALGYGARVVGPALLELPNTTIFVTPEYNVVCDCIGTYTMLLKSREGEFLDRVMACQTRE